MPSREVLLALIATYYIGAFLWIVIDEIRWVRHGRP